MSKLFFLTILSLCTSNAFAQQLKYTNADNSWNEDSLGNHRVVVSFAGNGNVAKTIIEWRRRDDNPANKRLIIEDAKTHSKIENVKTRIINNEKGEIWFEPTSGKGEYYIYYMPYKNEGSSNYPKGIYLKPENTASASWLQSVKENMPVNTLVKEIQSIDAFNSFFPMEVIATENETEAIVSKSKRKDFMVFPEDRMNPVKMTDRLPYRWIEEGLQTSYKGEAAKGENFTYQLGVYALKPLQELTVVFTDLKDAKGNIISTKNISCLNTSGVDYTGAPFTKTVDIAAGKVQALWCLINVPQNTQAGIYSGDAIIKTKNTLPFPIKIFLSVNNKVLPDGGISEPWKQTRLEWLNSTLAQENTVIAPYTALEVKDSVISLLGRKISLNSDGFPAQIQTFFTQEMTDYQTEPNNLFTEPMHFHVYDADGKDIPWQKGGIHFIKQTAGTVQWTATNKIGDLQMEIDASLEFDGFMAYKVKITAMQDVSLKDIIMHIPMLPSSAKYIMGLGEKGELRPDSIGWKWNVATKNQDGAWIGAVNAGLQFSLRDENYVRPLNTNFYLQKPLLLPASWGNDNKGGISISQKGKAILVSSYSGERQMKKGDVLYYNFTFLITPFHPINTDFQWANRFYHRYANLDTIKATGATIVNIHHATPINPWINYPFIEYKKMKNYIDSAHALGLKVKIYNTIRELSDHAYETFPMRSLGHEIYSPGEGGGFSWLQEHIGSDYIAAWFVPEIKDAAIVNSGMSRWHNYYVEGMNWLTQKVGIDGIYLDDVAFDRVTMKRIKRVLTKDGHPGIIDLHSANQYNKSDGFNNSANLYMEHFPYLNRLWFGEYFDYQKNDPAFFLTEVSGIPFGLMGEMLQDGGNPWRGMIYGMTNRYPWTEDADPRPIWKFWDEFGMKGTEMIGYWSDNCPVKTNNEKVLATVYKKTGVTLISLASWADADVTVQLKIDWPRLGIDPAKATITAREIKNFQVAKTFKVGEEVKVEKGKGWLLEVR